MLPTGIRGRSVSPPTPMPANARNRGRNENQNQNQNQNANGAVRDEPFAGSLDQSVAVGSPYGG